MTTYHTFDDPPLARGADVELAAADARHTSLAYCIRNARCWWCGARLPSYTPRPGIGGLPPELPTCAKCKQEHRAEVRG